MSRVQNSPASYGWLAGLLTFLASLLILDSGCCSQYVKRTQHAYEASVLIQATCLRPDGVGLYFGSGVVVSPNRVLTAAHVANAGALCSYTVTGYDGKTRQMRPRVSLAEFDLAALVLSEGDLFPYTPVHFGSKPDVGDRVCSAPAFPRRGHKCGEVQPYADNPGDITMNVVVDHGNSGGALYDDNGYLVGLVTHLTQCTNDQYCEGRASSLEGHLVELLK